MAEIQFCWKMDIGNFMSEDNDELKPNLEPVKQICRCCLSIETRMKNVALFEPYFRDLADIHVSESDGLPQWLCIACVMQLYKAVRFKQKVLRAHKLLNEYLMRCAPFPIDAHDHELHKYASPPLRAALTLCVAADEAPGLGFHEVLQHQKQGLNPGLCTIEVPALGAAGGGVKEEAGGCSDYEDDLPLLEYKSTVPKPEAAALVTEDDSQPLLEECGERTGRRARRVRRRAEREERKQRKLAKAQIEVHTEETAAPRRRVRAVVQIDPLKIRTVTLDPEEQFRLSREMKLSNKLPHMCHLCYASYNFDHKLQNHMRKHSPSRGRYTCKLCSMYFPSQYSLRVHTLIHTTRYECRRCGRQMIDRYSIIDHYRHEHEGIANVCTCDICGKQSSNEKTHRSHMRNQHSGRRPECHRCGKSFVNKDALVEHMQIHDDIKNFECATCQQRFRTNTQLKHHALSHSDVRAFYCVECDARFKSAHSMRGHLRKSLKHRDSSSLHFACLRCDKRYDKEKDLQVHVKVQHDGLREHPCPLCSAPLATANSLRKHMKHVHRGHQPPLRHVCDMCGKAFRGKSALTNHLRTHTGEKPFECALCGRKFAQRSSMRLHVKLVHLKLQRRKKTKEVAAPVVRFPKQEVSVGFEAWSREEPACDEFFQVSAGS